jgi:WG containing repeat
MKKILSLLGFCVLAFHGFGQVKKIEKRSYGLLDTVYYVNGGDTVCIESFHRNGLLKARHWKKDSTEIYNNQGKLVSKTYARVKYDMDFHNMDRKNIYSESKEYFPSGELMERGHWQGDSIFNNTRFDVDGKIEISETWHKMKVSNSNAYVFYHTRLAKNEKIYSYKEDTLTLTSTDSVFYDKKQLSYATHTKNKQVVEYMTYDKNQKLTHYWTIDSNRLHLDKDNGDCLYGFRNLKGNWIIPPQYDDAKSFNTKYFIVNKNQKYGIIDDFGKTILPLEYDFMGLLNNDKYGHLNPYYDDRYSYEKPKDIFPLKFRIGGKYGLMDFKGQVLLPPQYDNVREVKGDTFEVQIGQKWGLVDSKGRIIVHPKYYKVYFTTLPNTFVVVDTVMIGDGYKRTEEIKGLIDDKGKMLLDIKFSKIEQEYKKSSIFQVKSYNKGAYSNNYLAYEGIFDLNRGWILDTTFIKNNHGIYEFVKRHPLYPDSVISKRKYGYVNDKYETILPFEYDIHAFVKINYDPKSCIERQSTVCNSMDTFFICNKDKKYGIFDKRNQKWLIPLKYDFIHEFIISYSNDNYGSIHNSYENDIRFIALKDGKWRWINMNDKQLSPDLYDYAGTAMYEGMFLIRDSKVTIVKNDYFPQNIPYEQFLKYSHSNQKEDLIELKDFTKEELAINRFERLVIPPQYFIVSKFGKHAVLKDENGNQFLIDFEGNKRPFLQNYKVHLAQINEGIVVVEDTLKHLFGILTPEGKTILPIKYYAISALDSSDVIWAKSNRPSMIEAQKQKSKSRYDNYKEEGNYYLNPIDSGWTLFNKKGVALSKTSFAFPFEIHHNHGIGVLRVSEDGREYKAGIWRTSDGANVLPPQYDHIFFDEFNRLYHIYKKDDLGLKVGVCDSTGRILVEPKYDRMSVFNGNYALVQEGGKLGVIMRNGQLKIPPQYNAFKNTKEDIDALLCTFIDSINKDNIKDRMTRIYQRNGFTKIEDLQERNYDEKNTGVFDSLDKETVRVLKNLITEIISEGEFIDGEFIPLNRSSISIFKKKEFTIDGYWGNLGLNSMVYVLSKAYANKKSIGFILGDDENRTPRTCGNRSYNYRMYNYMQNDKGEWNNVQLEDLLTINPDNAFKINQLIIDKIRDLKDSRLDCSNSAAYFEKTKDRFRVFPEGIKLYLSRGNWRNGRDLIEPVEILLTWDELKPYLKKKE